MVPDATHAACSEEKMATSVQEFCHAIALTRAPRKTAAKVRRKEQGLTGAVSPNERRDDDMSNDDEESGKSKFWNSYDAYMCGVLPVLAVTLDTENTLLPARALIAMFRTHCFTSAGTHFRNRIQFY